MAECSPDNFSRPLRGGTITATPTRTSNATFRKPAFTFPLPPTRGTSLLEIDDVPTTRCDLRNWQLLASTLFLGRNIPRRSVSLGLRKGTILWSAEAEQWCTKNAHRCAY